MHVNIQPYQEDHKDEIANLILDIQQREFHIAISLSDQPDLLDIRNFYRRGNGNFWCAISTEGEVIGTIALIDMGNGMGAIRKMFVREDWRGKERNVASSLLYTLETWALKYGIKTLYLGTVDVLKAAQRFYNREGFVVVDAADLPASFPRMPVDTLFFRKDLFATIL
jgi:N-acetylglutamate synthase-like GNAT family acetyltransferase